MSDLRMALVAEGKTDRILIEAALKAILAPRRFTLALLQPEATRPTMGEGWCGVLKWCRDTGRRHPASLDSDPTLPGFDLIMIHLDLDVATKRYDQCGQAVANWAIENAWPALPCARPCPPVEDTLIPLEQALRRWLLPATPGPRTVLCIPAQSTGTWLAAAVLDRAHRWLIGAECQLNLEDRLSQLPKQDRIRKSVRDYRRVEQLLTANWATVTATCTTAARFHAAVKSALGLE